MLLLTLKPIIAEQHGSPWEKRCGPHEGKKKCGLVTKHAVEELYNNNNNNKISLFKLMPKEKCKGSNDFQEAEFKVTQIITRYSIKMNWALHV